MESPWDLAEWIGVRGDKLALYAIPCPFCSEAGNYSFEHKASVKRADGKELHFDTLKCGNCAKYILVFWSAALNRGLHDFRMLPFPTKISRAPPLWPADIGRYWLDAQRSLASEIWPSAAMMARSALQLALRQTGAKGRNLKEEIDDLAAKGILPQVMKDWSHELRELANDAAHPEPGQAPTTPKDAKDIVRFLDYLLEYLYTLPHQIQEYRARKP